MGLIEAYKEHTRERAEQNVPPLPLSAEQTAELVSLLAAKPVPEPEYLLDLFTNHISPGVDEAARVKAEFLDAVIRGKAASEIISAPEAVVILGTMLGGY
ncbi:MAG: aconitate hydratase B, partial [Spirochaetota bacterium]|nr:aconitate hydratase B [Spirochaetota bacterium]